METDGKQYEVIVAERAAEMLVGHARFLAQVSEAAAARLVEQFQANAASLQTMPERFSWLSDPLLPEHTYRKLLFEKRYLLVYKVTDTTVYIDAVMDCRQDYARLLV
jgi:plasmid stabilization system protein ParE